MENKSNWHYWNPMSKNIFEKSFNYLKKYYE